MPEIPDSLISKQARGKDSESLIRWRTISYRTLTFWSGTVVVLVAVVLLVVFPEWRTALARLISGAGTDDSQTQANLAARQARFTNLDGDVRVRKANEVQWNAADPATSLDKGDLIQTSRDGVARIAFADGTVYVVKPNTLIVIEENAVPDDRSASHVAVQVSSGVVDLSTSRLAGQSRVLFANAEALLRDASRAQVTNDPETSTHQITVSKGGAHLRRGSEQLELAEYEQAKFAGPDSPIVKERMAAPPILLTPANMAPVVLSGSEAAEVQFSWNPVPGVESYRLRVSASPIFSSLLYDRRVRSTSVRGPSLKMGDYYWTVTSIDSRGQQTQQSEANQFSVIRQQDGGELLLVVEQYIQHGKVVEIIGRTEPGATVLVNNQPVFSVAQNGSFKHFTPPLPNVGSNLITITAQNSEGKVATLRKTITIQ